MTMVSGGLFVAVPLLHRAFLFANSGLAAEAMLDVEQYLLVVGALVFVPVGMVGFHALQKWNYGLMGHAGLWTSVLSSMVVASGMALYLWRDDTALLWLVSPLGALGLVTGFLFYGAATLQAGRLPRWCGIAFMVALPAAIALVWLRPIFGLGEGSSTTSVLFGLAWLGLGHALWARRKDRR